MPLPTDRKPGDVITAADVNSISRDVNAAVPNVSVVATGVASTDTAAINAALAGLPAAPGSRTLRLRGSYGIDPAVGIDVPSNCTLDLSGAVFTSAASSATTYELFRVWARTNVRILNGRIVGDRAIHVGTTGEWGHGISIQASTDVVVSQTEVVDCWGDGIYVGGGTSECRSVRLIAVRSLGNRRQGCSVTAAIGGGAFGCTFANTSGTAPQSGIDLEAEGGKVVRGFVIDGCESYGNAGPGFLIFGVNSTDNTVTGCSSHDNTGEGIRIGRASGNSVTGNSAYDNTGVGILVDALASGSAANDNSVTGNEVFSNFEGIQIIATSASSASGNAVTGNSARVNDRNGIVISAAAGNAVTGNACRANVRAGIFVEQAQAVDNTVAGNTCVGNTERGIYLNVAHFNTVADNTSSRNGLHGIHLAASSDNTVVDNTCVGNSQTTDITGDNIQVSGAAERNNVQGNTCRIGAGTKRPRYGLHLANSTTLATLATNNDLLNGGAAATNPNLADFATGTITAAGNRVA